MTKPIDDNQQPDLPSSNGGAGGAVAAPRSRVTKGKDILIGANGRTAETRRYRDLVDAHSSDLGGGELLSEAQNQLIRRTAGLAIHLEKIEKDLVNGEPVDVEDQVKLVRAQVCVLKAIGLKRVAREIPGLAAKFPARNVTVNRWNGSVI